MNPFFDKSLCIVLPVAFLKTDKANCILDLDHSKFLTLDHEKHEPTNLVCLKANLMRAA